MCDTLRVWVGTTGRCVGSELVYESVTHRTTYRLNDAVTNISTGTLQQLTNTFLALFGMNGKRTLIDFKSSPPMLF